MQTKNKLFDDVAKVAGGALGALVGVKGEAGSLLHQRVERLLTGMNLVSREEFDAVKAMAAKARTEQAAIAKRLAEIEQALPAKAKRAAPAARKTARKPAKKTAKKTAKKAAR
jgi:BMFP domain-containing protein YqiC